MKGSAGGRPHGADLFFWVFTLVAFANAVIFLVAWFGGTLGAAATMHGWHPPPVKLDSYVLLVSGQTGVLWPGVAPVAVYAGMLVLTLLLVLPAGLAARKVMELRTRGKGLAGAHELATLAPAGIAARARELRPSLNGMRDLPPDERGDLLGDLMPNGPELRSSYEDVELDLMAPRSGKTTGLAIPAILRARGPVLLTSNKSDVYSVTRAERSSARSGPSTRSRSPTPRARCGGTSSPTPAISGRSGWPGTSSPAATTTPPAATSGHRREQHPRCPLPRRRPPAARSPTSWPGSPSRPTAPRWTCSPTPA